MRISDWSSDVCSSDLHVARIASARIKIVAKRSSDALLHWSEKFADGRRANGALEPDAQKHTIYRLPFYRRLVRTHAANRVIVRLEVRTTNPPAQKQEGKRGDKDKSGSVSGNIGG